MHREMESPSKKFAWGEAKFSITLDENKAMASLSEKFKDL
jgi:hypothetical protein